MSSIWAGELPLSPYDAESRSRVLASGLSVALIRWRNATSRMFFPSLASTLRV